MITRAWLILLLFGFTACAAWQDDYFLQKGISLKSADQSMCPSQPDVNTCFEAIAAIRNDPTICGQGFNTQELLDGCYQSIALYNYNPAMCANIANAETRKSCISGATVPPDGEAPITQAAAAGVQPTPKKPASSNWIDLPSLVLLLFFGGVMIGAFLFMPRKPRFGTPQEEAAYREERARELARQETRDERRGGFGGGGFGGGGSGRWRW